MTTPILTKIQQRKSLSAKKGPSKGLKNVLSQPNENYWPLLKNDYGAELEHILKRLLPSLKRTEIKVPWSQLRKMNKAERTAAREAAKTESNADCDATNVKSIVFGINAITKLLEKNNVCCILLDASVDPSLLIKHIVTMAQSKNVHTILISFLKKITLETIGFAAAAVGLKKHVEKSSEDYFNPLFIKVSELSRDIHSKAPVTLFKEETHEDDPNNSIKIQKEEIMNDENVAKNVVEKFPVSTDIYLYRKSKQERIFEPPDSSKSKESNRVPSDFIAIDDDKYLPDKKDVSLRFFQKEKNDVYSNHKVENSANEKSKKKMGKTSNMTVRSKKCQASYKPLKVKRLQGNESRVKATKPPKIKKKK